MDPILSAKVAIDRLLREAPIMDWRAVDSKPGMRAYEANRNGLCSMVVEYNGPDGIACAGSLVNSKTGLVVFLPAETAAKIYRDISKARN